MSETAKFEYKCRRCGVIDNSTGTNAALGYQIMLSLIHDAIPMPEMQSGNIPAMLDTHFCGDGGHGVADFIGISIQG